MRKSDAACAFLSSLDPFAPRQFFNWHALRSTFGMDINPRLYVEIHPFDGPHSPHPHPVDDGHFDPDYVYKILGMYNPSETSECYFVLSNPQRQIWFIPQRHLLAYRLIDSDEFFLSKDEIESRKIGRLQSRA